MPGFQFELSQLVNVPGKDQQGRVTGRTEYVNGPSAYLVSWLSAALDVDDETFDEGELAEAQKPKANPVSEVKVELTADTAQFEADLDRATEKARGLEAAAEAAAASLDRLPRNVLNLGKAKRGPATKRSKRK